MPDIAVHSLPAGDPSPDDQMMVIRANTTLALTSAAARDGVDGNMWHVDAGDPPDTLGQPNDYYLDSTGGWIWVKRSSKWSNTYGNLKVNGQDGNTGLLEIDLNADYQWHGSHTFDGAGEVQFTNEDGAAITLDGWGSDYTGEGHDHAWFKVRQNANGENWVYFGPTSTYWENRVSLGNGHITFAQDSSSTPSVKIDKSGLKVNGSTVSRNATLLSSLRSSNSFKELKAKLIEALETEEAELLEQDTPQ